MDPAISQFSLYASLVACLVSIRGLSYRQYYCKSNTTPWDPAFKSIQPENNQTLIPSPSRDPIQSDPPTTIHIHTSTDCPLPPLMIVGWLCLPLYAIPQQKDIPRGISIECFSVLWPNKNVSKSLRYARFPGGHT